MGENWTLFLRNIGEFWKTFHRNKLGLIGAFLVMVAAFVALFAPALTSHDSREIIRDDNNRALTFAPPSVHGILGTDDAGHSRAEGFVVTRTSAVGTMDALRSTGQRARRKERSWQSR